MYDQPNSDEVEVIISPLPPSSVNDIEAHESPAGDDWLSDKSDPDEGDDFEDEDRDEPGSLSPDEAANEDDALENEPLDEELENGQSDEED